MTRITYLIDNLLRAGTQTALGHLAEGLALRGYDQAIYCLNRRFDPGVVAGLEATGARVVVLGKTQLAAGLGLARLYAAARRTDVLQTFLPAADVIGRTIGRAARTPLIVTSIRARNVDKRPWQLRLDRRTMRWAHRVVFNAHSVVDFSIRHEGVQPEQAVVIPNGVRFRAPTGRGRQILDGRVPPEAPVIGTVGRLRPQKGHAVLIEAFAQIAGRTPAHLALVGEGELRETLGRQAAEAGVGERVHFLGARADLPDFYAALDVYAHPAMFEGMPNAVMEALAAGLPVVATGVDGTRELIREGETGWMVPAGDAGALADRLLAVLADPTAARQVGETASKYVLAEFSVERMVAAFDGVYRHGSGRREM